MKITHIPKDNLIKIRYDKHEKVVVIAAINLMAKYFEEEVEELKQTG